MTSGREEGEGQNESNEMSSKEIIWVSGSDK
jgi:hypothetical protein